MNIILFFLAIITALVLVIFFTPIKYGLEASYEQNLEYSIRLGAGFWWRFSIQQEQQKKSWQLKILGLTVPQGDRKALVKPSKAERAPKQPNKKKSSNSLKTLKSFGENKMHISCWRLLKRILGAIIPDFIQIRGRYGFYEPHFTAWCIPFLCALDGMGKICSIDLIAVWEEECLELEVKSSGSILPALLLWYIISFFLQVSTLRFFLALKKSRKKIPAASAT
jgi:hypothetical protein